MMTRGNKLVILTLFISALFIGGIGSGEVVAQSCETPSDIGDCTGTLTGYEDLLEAAFVITKLTLQYAGMTGLFIGTIIYFTAKKSSERGQTGVWLIMGGLVMIALYFGMNTLVEIIKYVGKGRDTYSP